MRFDEDIDLAELDQLRKKVLNKSSGIFLWVNLAVLQLNEVFDRCGQMKAVWERLEEMPRAAKEAQAPNGERALYGLFQDVVQKDNRNVPELIRLAQIVFCAKRSLNPKELYVALIQSYSSPFESLGVSDQALTKKVREASKGLAEVTGSEEPIVQFIHETVREFIRDGGLAIWTKEPMHTEGYEIMKLSCLAQIQAPIASHIEILADYRTRKKFRPDVRDKNAKKGEHQEFVRQTREKFPFLDYATSNIFFHADEAEFNGKTQSNFLEKFPLVEWISIYNLFQDVSTKRFRGPGTTVLYVLADQGCNNLIKNRSALRENYALSIRGEEFPSALLCGLYSGHQGTAWTLAALDTKYIPKEAISLRRADFRGGGGLLGALSRVGDAQLLRKVLQEGHCTDTEISDEIFADARSAEVAEVLVEYALRRGGLPLFSEFPEVVETGSSPHASRLFLCHAIEQNPDLLKAKVWGGKSMLDYAIAMNFPSLASFYLERTTPENYQSSVDQSLRGAVIAGNLETAQRAHHLGANFGSRDEESGGTIVHLAAEYLTDYSVVLWNPRFRGKRRLDILFFACTEAPWGFEYCGITDTRGRTAKSTLLKAIPDFFETLCLASIHPPDWIGICDVLLQILRIIGANFSQLVPCNRCELHHKTSIPIAAITNFCDDDFLQALVACGQQDCLDRRDTLGRTALSWCFAHRHGVTKLDEQGMVSPFRVALNGRTLLRETSVDVNSRDNAGYTVLEHFLRHPCYSKYWRFENFVKDFFRSDRLDPNLPTSGGESPLELIISLYDTWPADFGDMQDTWDMSPKAWFSGNWAPRVISGQERQEVFSQHLVQAAGLLLGTGKVDRTLQVRCATCEQTPPAIREIIVANLDSQFPGWSPGAETQIPNHLEAGLDEEFWIYYP